MVSLNLIILRLVGRWDILLHPWFFLSTVTLDLRLYSVVVYFGRRNKTLIGMMLGGLAATLGTLVYTGMGASAIATGLVRLGDFVMPMGSPRAFHIDELLAVLDFFSKTDLRIESCKRPR